MDAAPDMLYLLVGGDLTLVDQLVKDDAELAARRDDVVRGVLRLGSPNGVVCDLEGLGRDRPDGDAQVRQRYAAVDDVRSAEGLEERLVVL